MPRWLGNPSLQEKFEALVTPEPMSGCWLWTGYGTAEGYGRLQVGDRKVLAHRLSYELFVGPIPEGMLVRHRCDVPPCVNPAHLMLGTDAENTLDKMIRRRHARGPEHSKWARGEKQHMSKLTEELVKKIRSDERSQQAIADELGVAQTLISAVKRRMIWKHVS